MLGIASIGACYSGAGTGDAVYNKGLGRVTCVFVLCPDERQSDVAWL
jgi:hypothetical protein